MAAPNHETRSLAWQKGLEVLCDGVTHSRLLVGLITVQSEKHQNVVLERLKWRHVEQAHNYLKQQERHLFSWKQEAITYPHDCSVHVLEGILESWTNSLNHPFAVYLDLSGLPAKAILGFMKVFRCFVKSGHIARLLLMYAWAPRYPQAVLPMNTGVLKMAEDNVSLSLFCENILDIRGALVIGQEIYSGRLFLDSLPPSAQIDAYVFFAKDDPLSSLYAAYANSSLLSEIDVRTNVNLHHFLSIPRGHRMLVDNASQVAVEWQEASRPQRAHAYLVAPFGPKPLLVSGYIASCIVRRSGGRSGIVLPSSHQFGDQYSTGWSCLSCFEVDLKELAIGKDDDN